MSVRHVYVVDAGCPPPFGNDVFVLYVHGVDADCHCPCPPTGGDDVSVLLCHCPPQVVIM